MNTKTKIKIMVDIIMTIIFVLLMDLDFINLNMHERLGIFSLILIGTHLFLNKEWVKGLFTKKEEQNKLNFKTIINILTSVIAIFAVGTGILISKTIFNFSVSDNPVITTLHIFSGYGLGILLLLHIFDHFKYLKAVFKNVYNKENVSDMKNGAIKLLALLFAGVIVYITFIKATQEKINYNDMNGTSSVNIESNTTSSNDVIETNVVNDTEMNMDETTSKTSEATSSSTTKTTASSSQKVDEATTSTKKENDGTSTSSQNTSNDTTAQDVQTLNEYLSKLICTGCGKRCLLTAPRCGIGVRQAKAAETEYYQTIGSN